jgi:hypothetical protein
MAVGPMMVIKKFGFKFQVLSLKIHFPASSF